MVTFLLIWSILGGLIFLRILVVDLKTETIRALYEHSFRWKNCLFLFLSGPAVWLSWLIVHFIKFMEKNFSQWIRPVARWLESENKS